MKKGREFPLLRAAAYTMFFLLVAGAAFGRFYASTAPQRLKPIEKSKPLAAISGYTEAIRLSPADGDLYTRRGVTDLILGRYRDAVGDFTRAAELSPDNPEPFLGRGYALLELGDARSAEMDLEQSIQRRATGDAKKSLEEGFLASLRGQREQAIRMYTAALSSKLAQDDRCTALINRSSDYGETGQQEKALDDLNAAFSVCENQKDREDILVSRGVHYSLVNRNDLALRDWAMALSINPNNATVFRNRASLFEKDGEFEAALSEVNRYIELQPNDPEGYTMRADVYFKMNKKELAEADLKTANDLLRLNRPLHQFPVGGSLWRKTD